jgi:hypothetical protein
MKSYTSYPTPCTLFRPVACGIHEVVLLAAVCAEPIHDAALPWLPFELSEDQWAVACPITEPIWSPSTETVLGRVDKVATKVGILFAWSRIQGDWFGPGLDHEIRILSDGVLLVVDLHLFTTPGKSKKKE